MGMFVLDLPRSETHSGSKRSTTLYSLYEMAGGGVGSCHAGRTYHPVLPQTGDGSLQIFGTDGNLIFGLGYCRLDHQQAQASAAQRGGGWMVSPRSLDGDFSKAKWPQPVAGGFNYYHASTQHFVDCILEDREPLVNVDWGLHITEMMAGAIESYTTGRRYDMTTTLDD